ncbi:hypothetical protein BC832DRAFT_615064 [Gaertneriomyces semiglobifer]|nr:hypothetical protein BC832DRAFT_615064 [Gaertneriomyces semiglobifer]
MTVPVEGHICRLYKTYRGYIGQLSIEAPQERESKTLPTPVLIVDISGSMGKHASRLICKLLPETLKRLGYASDHTVHLITFASEAVHHTATLKQLSELQIRHGATYMAGVPAVLQTIIARRRFLDPAYIMDTDQTQKAAAELAHKVRRTRSVIRSHAIRFGTGGLPDTRALSSLLQVDNTGFPVAVEDVSAKCLDEDIVSMTVDILGRDQAFTAQTLEVKGATARRLPWEQQGARNLNLLDGTTSLWLDQVPEAITVDGVPLHIEVFEEFVTRTKYAELLGKTLGGFLQHARVLKVVGTDDAKEKISQMLEYFEALEQCWAEQDVEDDKPSTDGKTTSLRARSQRLKRAMQKKTTSLRQQLSTILNDERVHKMNASQQADYLRTVDVSKTSKGLAGRAANSAGGFDFDTIARDEVTAMHSHLSELADVDDSQHMVSFYSLATTLEGIKTVCQLVDDGIVDQLSASDILELFNVVGIACDAPVGDYPDPMTYRVKEMHPGCAVSLADVLAYTIESGGEDIETPGTRKTIRNVIPVFEDPRIFHFLRKYAPTLMEYLASVGMRRLIADVPMTMGYTILSGVLGMTHMLTTNRSEVAIKSFLQLTNQLPVVAGPYFASTLGLLDGSNDDPRQAFSLLQNGVSNMLVAILHAVTDSGIREKLDMAKLLRALYSHEVYVAVRRRYRASGNPPSEIERMIHQYFDVDFSARWCVPVKGLFEADAPPDEVEASWPTDVSDTYVSKLWEDCWYVDILTLIPTLFSIAVQPVTFEEKVIAIKQLPAFDEAFKQKALGVKDLDRFRRTCLLQALLFPTQESRLSKTGCSLLPDPGCEEEASLLVERTLRDTYVKQYTKDLEKKKREEDAILIAELTHTLISAADMDEFARLMKEGVSRGTRTLRLEGPFSPAFKPFEALLFTEEPREPIPAHAEKLAAIISGSTADGTAIWNSGNMLFPVRKSWGKILIQLGRVDLWRELKTKARARRHRYRADDANRHGHSNELPSFWALGFATMKDMEESVTSEAMEEYLAKHPNCCGNWTRTLD